MNNKKINIDLISYMLFVNKFINDFVCALKTERYQSIIYNNVVCLFNSCYKHPTTTTVYHANQGIIVVSLLNNNDNKEDKLYVR